MKKITRKNLRLDSETIRALVTRELTDAVGGWDTGIVVCGAPANSPAAQCPALAIPGTLEPLKAKG